MRIVLIALFCVTPLCAEAWQPEKSWVFASGVLNFEAGISGWPDEGRVDSIMIQSFKHRGVPPDQVVFLKNAQATKQAMLTGLKKQAGAAGEGDTLIFYYAGHGTRRYIKEARESSIVPYDSKPDDVDSDIRIARVFDIIEKNFKGNRVIILADCCHSGEFKVEAEKRAANSEKFSYAVLTSAHASSRSTGEWTFTQCLVDMLDGKALVDTDGNGELSFAETAGYCEREMAFAEQQLSCSAVTGKLTTELVLAKAAAKTKPEIGKTLEAKDSGQWWRARVTDVKEGEYFVSWIGFGPEWSRWVKVSETRAYEPKVFAVDTHVEVEWDGVWYAAVVKETRLGLHYVAYDGYPEADNEWVPLNRMRLPEKK